MCFQGKQLHMKRRRKENGSCCLSSEKDEGDLQCRHCHLQEVNRALGLLTPECFHLDRAAVSQMVTCGQIQAGKLSMACDDEEEEQMQNEACFPLENIASAC